MFQNSQQHIIDDEDLFEIRELFECLGLAVEKILFKKTLIMHESEEHPAIPGYKQIVTEILDRESTDKVDEIF